jgi:hypothetical protein
MSWEQIRVGQLNALALRSLSTCQQQADMSHLVTMQGFQGMPGMQGFQGAGRQSHGKVSSDLLPHTSRLLA